MTGALWTGWAELGGTGEGVTFFARVARASSETEFREVLGKQRGEYYSEAVRVEPGVVRNHVTEILWPESTLVRLERSYDAGHVFLEGELHLNFS